MPSLDDPMAARRDRATTAERRSRVGPAAGSTCSWAKWRCRSQCRRLIASLSRRADKLGGVAATVDDPTTQQLATAASTSMEQLVHHLMVLERRLQRGEEAAGRRAR
jgi:hypothetical protein